MPITKGTVALDGDTTEIKFVTFVSNSNNAYRMIVITVDVAMQDGGGGE